MSKKIYIIAGEESGDNLGSSLMAALKEKSSDAIDFFGVGGKQMIAEGLDSIFPMEVLSVMGIAEILPKLFDLLSRIKQTVEDIEKQQPDVIVTIDSPDFCFRVIKAIKKRGLVKAPCVHYVAPSVWAWRPKRAKKVAVFLDHILALLPFEPPYFEKEGLPCTFVGHPMVDNDSLMNADGLKFRHKYNILEGQKILCVLAGSRHSELKRMLPIFKKVIERTKRENSNIKIISISLPHLKDSVEEYFANNDVLVLSEDKYDAFAASDVALATSGTVALELAMTGTPTVIGYKMGAVSSMLAKWLVKTPYVSLPNIILNQEVIPELLLSDCTADNLFKHINRLLTDEKASKTQKDSFSTIRNKFSSLSPSQKAADVVLSS